MRMLEKRLSVLEDRVPPLPATPETLTDYRALRAMLPMRRSGAEKPKPAGIAGVQHWRERIAIAERLAALPSPPDEPGKTNYSALRILCAKNGRPERHHALRGYELEVLKAEEHDRASLAAWEAEHARYAAIPWQWRPVDLPADAARAVEAAIAHVPEIAAEIQR